MASAYHLAAEKNDDIMMRALIAKGLFHPARAQQLASAYQFNSWSLLDLLASKSDRSKALELALKAGARSVPYRHPNASSEDPRFWSGLLLPAINDKSEAFQAVLKTVAEPESFKTSAFAARLIKETAKDEGVEMLKALKTFGVKPDLSHEQVRAIVYRALQFSTNGSALAVILEDPGYFALAKLNESASPAADGASRHKPLPALDLMEAVWSSKAPGLVLKMLVDSSYYTLAKPMGGVSGYHTAARLWMRTALDLKHSQRLSEATIPLVNQILPVLTQQAQKEHDAMAYGDKVALLKAATVWQDGEELARFIDILKPHLDQGQTAERFYADVLPELTGLAISTNSLKALETVAKRYPIAYPASSLIAGIFSANGDRLPEVLSSYRQLGVTLEQAMLPPEQGESFLMMATRHLDAPQLDALIAAFKPDLDALDKNGETLLTALLKEPRPSLDKLSVVLKAGANPASPTNKVGHR